MEPIKKKIVFDKLRNYYKNRLSAYNDGTLLEPEEPEYNNWGYFPVDIVMENENGEATHFDTLIEEKGPSYISETPYYETLVELEHTLPLNRFGFSLDENNETVVTKNLVLRYKILEHRYYLIRKFLESLRFYWFCKKNGRYSWVEIKDKDAADFYFSNIAENKMAVLNTLPNIGYLDFCSEEDFSNISGHTEELTYGEMHVVVNNDNSLVKGIGFKCWNGVSWCNIIAVTSMRDEVWEIFKIGDKDYTEIFYYFADFLLNKDELIVENIRAISSIPYINMNLYVEGESKAEGLLLPYLEEWEPNKKYYIGDTVKYKESGETEYSAYILTRSKDFEYVEEPESVYEASKNGALNDAEVRLRIIDDIPHFYRKEYYYKGYYDRVTKTTSFDTYDLNGESMHWTKTSNLNKNIADSFGEKMLKKPDFLTKDVLDAYENRTCKLGGLIRNMGNSTEISNAISVERLQDFSSLGMDYVITSFRLTSSADTLSEDDVNGNWERFKQTLKNADDSGTGIKIIQHCILFDPTRNNAKYIDKFDYDCLNQLSKYDSFYGIWMDEPGASASPSDPNGKWLKSTDGIVEFYERVKNVSEKIVVDVNLFPTYGLSPFYIVEDGNYIFNYNNNYAKYVSDYASGSDIIGADIYPIKYTVGSKYVPNGVDRDLQADIGEWTGGYKIETRVSRPKSWAITMNCLLTEFHKNPSKEYSFFIGTSNLLVFPKVKEYVIDPSTGEIVIEGGKKKVTNKNSYMLKNGGEALFNPIDMSLTIDDFYVNLWDTIPLLTKESLSIQCYCALISGVSNIRYFCLTNDDITYQYTHLKYQSSPYGSDKNNFERDSVIWNVVNEFNNASKFKVLKNYITKKYIYGVDIYKNNDFICDSVNDQNINKIKDKVGEFIGKVSQNAFFMASIGYDNEAGYCFVVNLDFDNPLTITPNYNKNVMMVSASLYDISEGLADNTIDVESGDICILKINFTNSMVSSYSESRINEVLRYKKSFDEDGSVLPFIAIDNTMYTEMKYCLGNTKTKYYDDGQLYTNTLNSIKLSRLDKPTKENYVEVIAKPNEVSEIGKYDAYYIVEENEETVSSININFVFGDGYSDKETHFLKIKNNFKEYEDVVFGREVKLYVGNKEKTLFMGENETPYINDKLIQNVNDEYIYFFVQFDNLLNTEEWYTKQAGVDFELVYDSVSPFNKITEGKEGLSTKPNSDYYKTLEGNNMIGFDYTLDRIANIDGNGFIEESGINMVEWHPYTISQYFCDYNGQYAWIKVDELDETIPIVETDAMPKASQANSKVYYCYTGEDVEKTANSGHTSYVVFEKDAVYRRVSVFYYIDIDYDRTYVYDEENGFLLVNNGMPITTFKPEVTHSNFEKVEGYTDESILGIVDIKSDIDAYIDRNPDFSSAFERHNILSEINTFLDLEHYKNNFFKL